MSDGTGTAFDIVRMEYGGHPVVFLYGEIDLMNSPKVHEGLSELIAERPSSILVDLANVTFLDSTGLSVLVVAHRHMHENGGELRLVSVPKEVAKVFEVTGLGDRFNVYADMDAAASDGPSAGSDPEPAPQG